MVLVLNERVVVPVPTWFVSAPVFAMAVDVAMAGMKLDSVTAEIGKTSEKMKKLKGAFLAAFAAAAMTDRGGAAMSE